MSTTPAALPDGGQGAVVSEEHIDPSQPIRAIFETSAMQLHTLGTARILFSFNETPEGIDGGVRVWTVSGTFEQRVYKHRHTIVQYRRSATQVTIAGNVPLGGELGTLTFNGTIANGTFTFSGTDALGAVSGVTSRAGPYLTGPATVSAAAERRTLSSGGCETTPPYLGTYAFGPTATGAWSAQNPVSLATATGELTTATVDLMSATNDGQGGYTYAGAFTGALWGYPSAPTVIDGPYAELEGDSVDVLMATNAGWYIFSFFWSMTNMFELAGLPPGYAGPPQYLPQLESWTNAGNNAYFGDNEVTPCFG